MTAPSRETREEWRREAQAGEYRHGKDCHWPMPCCCEATRILALLDALDAAEERLAAIRVYVDDAAIVDGPDGFDNDPRLLAWIDLDRIRGVLTGDGR